MNCKLISVLVFALACLATISIIVLIKISGEKDPIYTCEQICANEQSVYQLTGFNSTLWEERANSSVITHDRVELLRRVINTRCKLEITLCIEKAKQISLIQKRDALAKRNKEAGL